jgi:acetyltransferase-like isoleucine patch superfamily enzyme
VLGASQADAWRTKYSLLTTNYEPKSPVGRAGDRSDEKTVIVRGALMTVVCNPRLAAALLNAQLRMRGRAKVPLSVRLRGKVYIWGGGKVIFGQGITLIGIIVPIEFACHRNARIVIGDRTFINYGTSISAHELVSVGRECLFGHYTLILDNNQHDIKQHGVVPASSPVVIEDYVWIGSRVVILPGVRIGHHAVIGAGSVVTKDIPPRSVAVGNPARVIRYLAERAEEPSPVSALDAVRPHLDEIATGDYLTD